MEPACEAAKIAVFSDNAMAWYDYGKIVFPIGGSNCATGLGVADRGGKPLIAPRFSIGSFLQGGPYQTLKREAF